MTWHPCAPNQGIDGYISQLAQLASIFTHAPDALSLQSAVNKAGSAAWAYDHQWQLERKPWHVNPVKLVEKQSWHSSSATCWHGSMRVEDQQPSDSIPRPMTPVMYSCSKMWTPPSSGIGHFSLFVKEPDGCWVWACKAAAGNLEENDVQNGNFTCVIISLLYIRDVPYLRQVL